ncbi:hypothetical protein MCHI_001531 [Candidatus Magnetoovum chiemensis]|nr:hypothetical protein MCHI_001531 [Candidatus Magnetoovum chiemensis]
MKNILEYLNNAQPTPPAYAETLKPFNRAVIAKKVNCSTTYLTQIITGYKKPSKELESRLKALAFEIKQALCEVCNG